MYCKPCFFRYRAIAPRPLHGEPIKTEDSSKTPQGSGSSCSGRNTPQFEGQEARGKQGLKRGCDFEQPTAKKMKRGDAQGETSGNSRAAVVQWSMQHYSVPKLQPQRRNFEEGSRLELLVVKVNASGKQAATSFLVAAVGKIGKGFEQWSEENQDRKVGHCKRPL